MTNPLANKNKRNQPRKSNKNSQTKSSKSRKSSNNQLTLMVRTAPVAKAPQMRARNVTSQRTMSNGHTVFRSQTCLPISSTANTATAVTSFDLSVGTSAVFPAASNLAKNFDKVKWRRMNLKWVPALPTSAGGSVAMYMDTDRTDVGATTMQLAAQNKGAVLGALWDAATYNIPKQMLRGNEWFTTLQGSSGTENTFASPGRCHVLYTAQPGITYTTATVVGYLLVSYELEFGFPTGSTDSTVPTRRSAAKLRDSSLVSYDEETVRQYENFAAGCEVVPDFYQFLGLFDEEGHLLEHLALRFVPDEESLSLRPSEPKNVTVRKLTGVHPSVRADFVSDFLPNWSLEGTDEMDD
jgi:hypothetical protein